MGNTKEDILQKNKKLRKLVLEYRRNKNTQILDEIFKLILPTIKRAVRVFCASKYNYPCYFDEEELYSLFYITVYKEVIPRFNSKRGLFTTFCRKVFLNKSITLRNHLRTKKKIPRNRIVPLTQDIYNIPDPSNWYEDMIKEDSLQFAIEELNKLLSPFEKAIFFCRIQNMSYKNSSKYLSKCCKAKITPKYIDNGIQRIKKKAKKIKRIILGM